MRDIDILVHVLTIVSGFIAAILGLMLYLKYRIKMIIHYTMVIFSTSFMVTTTGVISYLSLYTGVGKYTLLRIIAFTIKEISDRLDRSIKTIDTHIYNIYQKTGVHSKIELLNIIRDIKF